HLRHEPERLGLEFQPGGWVAVDDLLSAAADDHFPISRAELLEVVEKNDKKRFAFDDTGERIRANHGPSAQADLQLEPEAPPAVLYHGTATRFLDEILRTGVKRMERHHVHLSSTSEAARSVGARHGKPVVLVVDATAMAAAGILFYQSANGV